jgi:hypothetical protein
MKLLLIFSISLFCRGGQSNEIPESIRPPADQKMIVRAHGVGDQIYTCQNKDGQFAWVLKAPEAQLLSADRQTLGRHFAGPSWEWADKSAVVGKMSASVPSPDANSIPWLLVNVIRHDGQGTLSAALTIQRVNTMGGKAAASGCDSGHVGETQRVPYEADYLFYGAN